MHASRTRRLNPSLNPDHLKLSNTAVNRFFIVFGITLDIGNEDFPTWHVLDVDSIRQSSNVALEQYWSQLRIMNFFPHYAVGLLSTPPVDSQGKSRMEHASGGHGL